MRACLAVAGFLVRGPVETMRAAITTASEAAPDVIVMSVNAPADADTRRRFVDWARVRGTPIVYLSAEADRATLERAVHGHAAACVLTPFTDRQLVATVLLATIAAERHPRVMRPPNGSIAERKLQAIAAVLNDVVRPTKRPLASGQQPVSSRRTRREPPSSCSRRGNERLSTCWPEAPGS